MKVTIQKMIKAQSDRENKKIKEWGDQVSLIVTEKSIVIKSREPAITFAAPNMRLSKINVSNLR